MGNKEIYSDAQMARKAGNKTAEEEKKGPERAETVRIEVDIRRNKAIERR